MPPLKGPPIAVVLPVAALATSLAAAAAGAPLWVIAAGAIVVLLVLVGAGRSVPRPTDEGRRRVLLAGAGLAGAAVAGAGAGRAILRLTRPDPGPAVEAMANGLGSKALTSLGRGYHPARSGDIQLVLAPFNTANYPHESRSLVPRDPRSSHALIWGYTDRVPIVVHAPGLVEPADRADPVTLADLAPTTARLLGFDLDAPDGRPLPGIEPPRRPPRLVVTFVIDGGGWNVLSAWPDAWPNLRSLMARSAVYRNAVMGSFPNVTASAHATIGTGAFPRTHGIAGHHLRRGGAIATAFGEPGAADPSDLLVPTLAEVWSERTGGRAWVGQIGYQLWHLGMIGSGGAPADGHAPVAVYWDEMNDVWASQNPDRYRMPRGVPDRRLLSSYLRRHFGERKGRELEVAGGRALCCDPPIARYQGDLVEATLTSERVGRGETTDLLYLNYKMPDYAGHAEGMGSERTRLALAAVDHELGRLVASLEWRFAPGEVALIVTADHGQCPLPEDAGGVRLDGVQLGADIEAGFGPGLVQAVRPSEVFLDREALRAADVTEAEIAAELGGYRYGENLGGYVPAAAVERDRLSRREFAAVVPGGLVAGLTPSRIAAAGAGRYPDADPGMPPARP